MAALDLNTLMDAVGTRLGTITGLRVYDYLEPIASPPAAIVGMPLEVDYDFTKGRGSDRVTIPVTVIVGKASDRAARDALSAYIAGSGANSIKAVLDGNLGGAVQTARTMSCRIEVITLEGAEYLGATFDLEAVS